MAHDSMSLTFRISPRADRHTIAEADARRVKIARQVARVGLGYCGSPAVVDDAVLIVSELVTNAIVHSGGTDVTFTMTVNDDCLRIAVRDEMPGAPTLRDSADEAERGRGLLLVSCLAEEHGGAWGTDDGGATTWCNLTLTGASH